MAWGEILAVVWAIVGERITFVTDGTTRERVCIVVLAGGGVGVGAGGG